VGDFPAELCPILYTNRNEVYVGTDPDVSSITALRFIQNQMLSDGILEDRLGWEKCPNLRVDVTGRT